MSYRPRVVDSELMSRLSSIGAVLVEGPKWCGKTTTAAHQAASTLYMQDPRSRQQNMELARVAPQVLLEGETPLLIDEWQIAPSLWDAVRYTVDQRGVAGQFILTGSSAPVADMSTSHSGTGRIARLRMRPMTLSESGDAQGGYSLSAVIDGEVPNPCANPLSVEDVLFLLCRGGWPALCGNVAPTSLQVARDYVDAVCESDINVADGVTRDPVRVRALLRSLARHTATAVPASQLQADVSAQEATSLNRATLSEYLRALERIFVLEDLAAWNPALRSRTAIRTSNTRHLCDPSLAAAALRIGPGDLLRDLETAGLLFESMCVRDLRVYAQALDGDVFHYRDKAGREADAVIHLRDGRWGLVEVKLGAHAAQAAADRLLALAADMDQDRLGAPSFLMVITAAGPAAYRTSDGVHVVPIGCLSL